MAFTVINELSVSKNKLTSRHLFFLYCLSLGFLLFVEAVMAYYFPIVLEDAMGSNLSAGLVIGLCNLAALACDFIFPEIFKKKTWKFLYLAAIILQFGYPGFTNLAIAVGGVGIFVVAALFWNVYYEFMAFSRQNFIVTNEKKEDYSRSWGIISVIGGIVGIIGPIVGSYLLKEALVNRVIIFSIFQILTLIIGLFLVSMSPKKEQEHSLRRPIHRKLSIFKDLKLWEILGLRVFPIIILGIIISLIGSAVMTFGGLMGVELFGGEDLDWLLIVVFAVPSIIVSLIMSKFPVKKYKKLFSQMLIILAGFCLALMPFIKTYPFLILTGFFFCSFFLSIAWILNEAVYSDLSERAKDEILYINGMERLNDSIGFLLGPIIIGLLADKTDYYTAFSFVGFACMIFGIVLMMITPRKIKIPHQELERTESGK
jgi:MFS family permease